MDEIVSDNSLNIGQTFFMLIGMLPFILCFPCWVVAKFVYEPILADSTKRTNEYLEEIKKPVPYEYKYPLVDCKNDRTETNPNNVVIDVTPNGYVAMRYSKDEEGFIYWADKNVSYKYLETVSRKYVNSFNCQGIYINRAVLLKEKLTKLRDEILNNIEKEKEEEDKQNEEKEEDEEDDVFANLKTYNTSSKRTNNLKKRITRDDIVCEKSNKYIKRGRFKDSGEWMVPIEEKVAVKEQKGGVLSWLSWKKQQTKKD